MTAFDDATRAQVRAADPTGSTWLSANAGSGKTRVLTDRVARLLLDGADPQSILCLTYTKAAAGEMQNRLFQRLGAWAMLDDDRLRDELGKLGVGAVDDLNRARTLFAAAIETPGGLKIQTIHSFCASLLRRFPLEAGVSPRFAEIDETTERQLRAETAEALADDPATAGAVDAVAHYITGDGFEKLTGEIDRHATRFPDHVDPDAIWAACGITPGLSREAIAANVFRGSEVGLLRSLVAALETSSTTDVRAAEKLRRAVALVPGFDTLPILESAFLLAKAPFTAKIGAFPTKALRESLPFIDDLEALMQRVADARPLRLGLAAAEKSLALHRFATAFLAAYEERKRSMSWLSFDDLIRATRGLLSESALADWVLYRLDGGIDHILVDEAQDTSPEQWDVIDLLARELTSGEGARAGRLRTLFAVGDKKQSIYAFQGADAEAFDRMRGHFAARLGDRTPLASRELTHSFRSSPAILAAVDRTFAVTGAGGVDPDLRHQAYKSDLPGRVDLWPLMPPSPKEEEGDWEDPVDRVSPSHATLQLARCIAADIRTMIDRGERVPDEEGGFRPISPGDVLILVQRRSGTPSLFDEIIRALKSERLPVAGADRLRLRDSLAVKDLVALLSFLALPEDDLSLAAALRSPLFGWSEAELYRLAAGRGPRFLWQELRERKAEFADTHGILRDLRDEADYLRPFDLLERILIRHHGRPQLLARLGAEAEDGIDELLNLALAYERTDVPSLTGFLSWLEAEDTEIKRQLESAGGRIRVMTVHGAKGLEAPVVILPDTIRKPPQFRDGLLVGDAGEVFWSVSAKECPEPLRALRDASVAGETRERERLLYVAMTRAQSWLIICGAGKPPNDSWHARVATALESLAVSTIDTPAGPGLRHSHGDWVSPSLPGPVRTPVAAPPPGWLFERVAAPSGPAPTVSPSELGGPKALPGDPSLGDEEASLRRGRQVHLLLEHLPAYPESAWPDTARTLLAHGEDAADDATAAVLIREVGTILRHRDLRPLFAAGTLAEVEVTAPLPELGGRRLLGVVDRLIVAEGRVLIVDFKTNAVVPDRPEDTPLGLLRQMGAYAAALAQIYPGRAVGTAILWTRTAKLMDLPHDIVMEALRSAATS